MGHTKAALRGKFIALSTYIRKLERSYTSHLAAHPKALEQKEASSPKRSKLQEILKLKAEINRNKENKQRFNETKSLFFEKIKIEKPIFKLTRRWRENIQIKKKIRSSH